MTLPISLRGRTLWTLCIVVLLSRLLLLAFSQWLPGDDGLRYLQEAMNLRDFGVFSSSLLKPPVATAHDLPVFPFLLSLILKIVPSQPLAFQICGAMNAVFFTAAAGFLYCIGMLLSANRPLAIAAATLFALFPETFPYSLFFMPDSLFTAVFMASIFFAVRFFRNERLPDLAWAFGLCAFSILVKPASLLFGFVLAFWVFALPLQARFPRRLLWVACGFCLELLVVSPWLVRNNREFGHPVLTTIAGTNLFRENYRLMLEEQNASTAPQILAGKEEEVHKSVANPVEESNRLGAIAGREIKGHVPAYLRTVIKRHPRLYLGTGSLALLRLVGGDQDTNKLEQWQSHPSLSGAKTLPPAVLLLQVGSWLVLATAYALALLGTVVLLRRRAWLPLLIGLLPLIYFAAIIGPVTYTRYRMPMAPFFALLAAYGIVQVGRRRSPELTVTSTYPAGEQLVNASLKR